MKPERKKTIFLTPEQTAARDRIVQGLKEDYELAVRERMAMVDWVCENQHLFQKDGRSDKEKART